MTIKELAKILMTLRELTCLASLADGTFLGRKFGGDGPQIDIGEDPSRMVTRGISRDPTSLARSALMPLSSHALLGSRRLATRLRFSRRLGMESIERLAGGRPASGGRGRWGGDAGLEHEGAQLDDIDGGASPPPLESPALTFAMCPGRRRCGSPPTSTYTARTSALTVRPRFVRAVYDLFLLRGDALLAAAAKR